MTDQVVEAPPQKPQWKDFEKFVAKLAWSSCKRAHMSGVLVEFDDVFQEASLAFVKAAAGFKPEKGFKFTTYCGVAVTTRLANFMRSMNRQLMGRTISLDASRGDDDAGESMNIYGLLPGGDPDPLDDLLLETEMDQSVRALGPLGGLMIEWILNPPEEVKQEIDGFAWKTREMSRNGSRRNGTRAEIDVQFLFSELLPRVLPQHAGEIKRMRTQVNKVVQAWNI